MRWSRPRPRRRRSTISYLRLAAEYDNFRKRTQREKDGIYQDAVADTVKKFLPVYDNLERALHHETADEAYKKGVEMTMTELVKILDALGIKPFGDAGETFDPQRHNAVMHVEDESLGRKRHRGGFPDRLCRWAIRSSASPWSRSQIENLQLNGIDILNL